MHLSAPIVGLSVLTEVVLAQQAGPSGTTTMETGFPPLASLIGPTAIPTITPELQKCYDTLFSAVGCKGNDWGCLCKIFFNSAADQSNLEPQEEFSKCAGNKNGEAAQYQSAQCFLWIKSQGFTNISQIITATQVNITRTVAATVEPTGSVKPKPTTTVVAPPTPEASSSAGIVSVNMLAAGALAGIAALRIFL